MILDSHNFEFNDILYESSYWRFEKIYEQFLLDLSLNTIYLQWEELILNNYIYSSTYSFSILVIYV